MHEPVIQAGLFCELARGDVRIADADEQAFRCVEERLFRFFSSRRDAQPCARS